MEEKELPVTWRTLDEAVELLLAEKAAGRRAYCNFNDIIFHSDTVTMDSAYMEVFGKTKAEYEKSQEIALKKLKEDEKRKTEEAIKNIPEWIAKGQSLIFPNRHDEWAKYVQMSAEGWTHGVDVKNVLELMEAFKNGATMEQAIQIFKNQGHSGNSETLIRNIMFQFSDKGPEFAEATSPHGLSDEEKKLFEDKKLENYKLASIYATEPGLGRHI